MRQASLLIFNIVLLLGFSLNAHADDNSSKLIKAMQSGGHILMIRHAIAPGFGDPKNIKIGDCKTQRNLDQNGRKQATEIGERLNENNIKPSAIYSSQWCRCLETAELLNLGEVKELSSLNSFFELTQNREPSVAALKEFIAEQNLDDELIIMVTHSVNISAISGQSVTSGGGVLLKLNESAPYEFVGTIHPSLLD